MYIHRKLELVLKTYLNAFPVIAVTGPRQSGKSTMLRKLFKKSHTYVTFDDFQIVNRFTDDPVGFFDSFSGPVIFDEAQKVPEIFDMIKLRVDQNREYGKFIISGSNQLHLLSKVKESLAGRIGIVNLFPFQFSEIPKKMRGEQEFRGSFPELVIRKYSFDKEWYSAYLDTYVNKDVRQISNIGNLRDFRMFINLLAANSTRILNMSAYASDIGVTVATIKHWISVLEASFIIFLLPPFYNNFGKRIIKAPKVYFYDTGFVSYLTGVRNEELYNLGPMSGAIFENYIVSEIVKKHTHENSDCDFFYLRTSKGVEIDLIVDWRTRKEWLEIKKSSTFKSKMIQNLKLFSKKCDEKILIYKGENINQSTWQALNYQSYLEDYIG